jgi:TonB family protein
MNQLQKKCAIGTAGIHLLLLFILIFGPAFFNQQPKTDNTVLDVIPANLVDAALNSGVRDAQAPQPAPAAIPPSLLRPPPPLPAPAPTPEPKVVQPPQPAPTPSPSLLDQFEKMFRQTKPTPTVTPNLKPTDRTEKSHDDNVKVNLTPVKHRDFSKNNPSHDNTSDSRAINTALTSLKHSLSSSTKIDMPGNASAAYANYATVVKSVYEQALRAHLPAQVAGNDEYTKVSVTIANDGTVISSEIISRSGDTTWDEAVQSTLDQVTFVARFPDGATEKERHYTLSFNPEVEKSFE